ncbi:MAG TPA: prenyltransferase/squalene oxidase repeat-containing protein [Solirubrobacteraceae bacterium]|nr:prenyltransferase/squalene oxidase repeat-containing protein [Solirubrobacteraceae bacterium]
MTVQTSIDPAAIRAALDSAREVLWRTQRPDGSWESLCDMGAIPTAQVLVALHAAGALDPADAADGARWLRSRQADDGSYRSHPTAAEGDLGATASAWAALHVCVPDASAQTITRARDWVEAHGGTAGVVEAFGRGDPAVVYVALAGLIEPSELPCPPMLPALIRPAVRFMERRFHSGILMVSGALTLIAHRLRGDWGPPAPPAPPAPRAPPALPDGPPSGQIARRFAARTLTLLKTFQNRDGSWNASTIQTALILPALRAAGLPAAHPMVARTVAWLEAQRVRDADGLHFEAFGSPVWCTAGNVRALIAAGAGPDDARLVRALDWLIGAQSRIEQPEVDNRNPGAPRVGGWAFQVGNETMVDNDDTGAVLTAFGSALGVAALNPETGGRVRASLDLGRDWLLGMQNPDGGWSAFVHGLPAKRPGPLFTGPVEVSLDDPIAAVRTLLDPPRELGDPSTEDLTGRVLDGLGRVGLTTSAPAVRRAIEFLRAQQFDHGGFWGRWTVNYLASTACVLEGLARVGADMSEPWVRQAVGFVLERQNGDGGWGELPDSYRDPGLAGRGPSMPPLTGLVVTGLIDAGEGSSDAVARGIAYLLGQQHADGTWPHADWLQAIVPPDTFYILAEAARHYPVEALARYLEAV